MSLPLCFGDLITKQLKLTTGRHADKFEKRDLDIPNI